MAPKKSARKAKSLRRGKKLAAKKSAKLWIQGMPGE
jgi:hypothetical protein